MRAARRFEPVRSSPRLVRRRSEERVELWTETVGDLPPVYGEGWLERDGRAYRRFEPARSKLAAGIAGGWSGPIPRLGERWLYLGAASGTTASHVADLVGRGGAVHVVEPSVRPFLQLLEVARRYPNLLPILGDGRRPDDYGGSVPTVDGVYADVAQPDQSEIVARNARAFLRPGGTVLFVVKTASLGREGRPLEGLARALEALPPELAIGERRPLEPFHRRHFLVAGRFGTGPDRPPAGPRIRPRSVRPAGRPR